MSREDAFNAAKGVAMLYGGFFKDVAQEIGMEKALAYYANQGKPMGAMLAGMLKNQVGNRELDLKTLESVYTVAVQQFGLAPEYEVLPTSLKVKNLQCPFYEGFKMAGLDDKAIESMCRQMAPVENAELTKVFPQLSGCVTFRSAPSEACVEEYTLKT